MNNKSSESIINKYSENIKELKQESISFISLLCILILLFDIVYG